MQVCQFGVDKDDPPDLSPQHPAVGPGVVQVDEEDRHLGHHQQVRHTQAHHHIVGRILQTGEPAMVVL